MKYIVREENKKVYEKGIENGMKIIIVGDGKVGYTLAEHLALENHDIVIVDKDEEALRKADETLDVMCIQGNGARKSVLIEAGIHEADILMAVTSTDEMNMICCLTAKKLAGIRTIARIRDPEYFEEFTELHEDMGIDMVINPEYSAALEIASILQFPSAVNIESFFGGKVRMAEFRILPDDKLVGKKLSKISGKLPKNMLFAAVERNGESYIPNGDFEFQEDDDVYVVGPLSGLTNFFKLRDHYVQKINTVMIVGGSRAAYYLTKTITKLGMDVSIIELDHEKCRSLSEDLSEAMLIEGDGTNPELLEAENIEEIDAFITMTGRDEENLITAMYALDRGVDKVIAMTSRVSLPTIIRKLGLDSVISPKLVTASYIIGYVRGVQNSRGSVIEGLYKIMDGKAEVISFIANNTTSFLNVALKDLPMKEGILIACILHKNTVLIPHGNEVIKAGDKVIIVSKSQHIIMDLNDILK